MDGNFSNEWHKLRANLLSVAGWLRVEINKVLEPFDLTQQQFNALRILRGQHKLAKKQSFSTLDLREHLLDKSSDTSRLVDRLCAKSLVNKQPCQHDSRRVELEISEKGLLLLEKIDEKMGEIDAILKIIPETEVKVLNEILDKISRKFEVK